MDKRSIKNKEEISLMSEGGKILAEVRDGTAAAVRPGMTTLELEQIANNLIVERGAEASFKLVPGYRHATCINLNDVVVHGIPNSTVINNGDLVGIDVGVYYKGFHTDTAISVVAGEDIHKRKKFLDIGKRALNIAISRAKIGKRIADISAAMQETVEAEGLSAVRALTGHGIGKNLHEDPPIPCYVIGKYEHSPILEENMVIAIEIMYNEGSYDVAYKNNDGWTIVTADGKISGLFEHTVAVTASGPVILTK